MKLLKTNFFIIILICALLSCEKEKDANSPAGYAINSLLVYVSPDYVKTEPVRSVEALKFDGPVLFHIVRSHTVDDKKAIRELAEQIGQLREKEESPIRNIKVSCEFLLSDASKLRLIFHHSGTIEWEGNYYKPDPDLLQILERALPEDYSNNRDYEYSWGPTSRGK